MHERAPLAWSPKENVGLRGTSFYFKNPAGGDEMSRKGSGERSPEV